MKDGNYILIQGWMVNRLQLRGNDLLAYAIIFGASQDMSSGCELSIRYLLEWIDDDSENAARAILRRLVEGGYVSAEERPGKATIYRCIPLSQIPPQKLKGSRARVTPANITTSNDKEEEEGGSYLHSTHSCAHADTRGVEPTPSFSFDEWWRVYANGKWGDEEEICRRILNAYTDEERQRVMAHTIWFAPDNLALPVAKRKHPRYYLYDKIWKGDKPEVEIKTLEGAECDTAKRNGIEVWNCRLPNGAFAFVTAEDAEKYGLTKNYKF